jgi:hypothetical protein
MKPLDFKVDGFFFSGISQGQEAMEEGTWV